MAEFLTVKSFGSLKPVDPDGEAYLKGLGIGEMVRVKVTKPRNPAFHRKVFALLQLAFENQDQFTNFDHFRRAVTIEAGYFEDRRMWDGSYMREAQSLSYGSMDETEFAKFFYAAFDVIRDFLGTDNTALAREVEQFMQVGAA